MATTLKPISELIAGIEDSAGLPVASGKARFYLPGTLTATTAYLDPAGATPATAPLTLNANGQATLYSLAPIRLIVKNTSESTTFYDDVVNLQRAEAVYVTHPSISGGAETTLHALLGDILSTLGSGFLFRHDSSGGVARTYGSALSELRVSVVDFGASPLGAIDATTAIQAAVDRAALVDGGTCFLPAGTYLISAPILIPANVNFIGEGRGVSTLRNNANTSAVSATGATMADEVRIEGFSIDHATTSAGSGVVITGGAIRTIIRNVWVTKHRIGISSLVGTATLIEKCVVAATDGDAAGYGIIGGSRGRVVDCDVTSNGTGKGIVISTDGHAANCRATSWVTGIEVSGVGRETVTGCMSVSCTNSFAVGAGGFTSNCHFTDCTSSSATTAAFSMSDAAGCSVTHCRSLGVAPTNDILGGGLDFTEHSNQWLATAPISNAATAASSPPWRVGMNDLGTSTDTTPTITPNISYHKNWHAAAYTIGSAVALTIAAHVTTSLVAGDVLLFTISKDGTGNITITWNAQYTTHSGTAVPVTITANSGMFFMFRWSGAAWVLMANHATPGWVV